MGNINANIMYAILVSRHRPQSRLLVPLTVEILVPGCWAEVF